MRIHMLASEPHYERHTRAIWRRLHPSIRGEMRVGRAATPRGIPRDEHIMVAGVMDIDRCREHRVIYVEHGAGQSYLGDPESKHSAFYPHAGAQHPDNVVAYVSPRKEIADAWGRPAIAVGCPALAPVVRSRAETAHYLTAVITFHWDAYRVCSEARSARPHWIDHLHTIVGWLRNHEIKVVGHWHPRDREALQIWQNLGVETVRNPDEALERASLVIADNTSFMYEAAAVGCRVLTLNAPWYRKNVEHGLRFWSHVPGTQVDDIDEILALDPLHIAHGTAAALKAYDHLPTPDTDWRAAQALTMLLA
jgi:hypothetical protein